MLEPRMIFDALRERGATFFTGVPDSLLKDFCAYVADNSGSSQHVIAANEGAAIAMAAGHHLGTGGLPVVYLQNSGIGNAINPLVSLADPEVYSVPMVLVVGWRGEPGVPDEPQHVKQGRVLPAILDAIELPYRVLSESDALADVAWATTVATETGRPVALIIRKGTFAPYATTGPADSVTMTREAAIEAIVDSLDLQDAIVSTTGMASRELFEVRARRGEHPRDFLTVGCMGHAAAIACAIAMSRTDRQIFCLDGDGAMLMHLGSLAVNAQIASTNFKHILINNGAHDSVGGQPTVALVVDLPGVARACGYTVIDSISRLDDVRSAVRKLRDVPGPALLEIRVSRGARRDLGRPTSTPRENKEAFLRFLEGL